MSQRVDIVVHRATIMQRLLMESARGVDTTRSCTGGIVCRMSERQTAGKAAAQKARRAPRRGGNTLMQRGSKGDTNGALAEVVAGGDIGRDGATLRCNLRQAHAMLSDRGGVDAYREQQRRQKSAPKSSSCQNLVIKFFLIIHFGANPRILEYKDTLFSNITTRSCRKKECSEGWVS